MTALLEHLYYPCVVLEVHWKMFSRGEYASLGIRKEDWAEDGGLGALRVFFHLVDDPRKEMHQYTNRHSRRTYDCIERLIDSTNGAAWVERVEHGFTFTPRYI